MDRIMSFSATVVLSVPAQVAVAQDIVRWSDLYPDDRMPVPICQIFPEACMPGNLQGSSLLVVGKDGVIPGRPEGLTLSEQPDARELFIADPRTLYVGSGRAIVAPPVDGNHAGSLERIPGADQDVVPICEIFASICEPGPGGPLGEQADHESDFGAAYDVQIEHLDGWSPSQDAYINVLPQDVFVSDGFVTIAPESSEWLQME